MTTMMIATTIALNRHCEQQLTGCKQGQGQEWDGGKREQV